MSTYETQHVAEYMTGIETITRCTPIDEVASITNQLDSTHQTVFVFEGETLVGLISPRESLYQRRYPGHTKVKKVMVEPMRIQAGTPIHTTAEFMVGTRMYTLPVFNGDELIGSIDADDILKPLADSKKDVWQALTPLLKIQKPITADSKTPVKDIYAQLKQHNISRIILTDNKGKVAGIISRKDLLLLFTTPDRERTRSASGINAEFGEWTPGSDRDTTNQYDAPAETYMSQFVITAPPGKTFHNYLQVMLDKQVHSVVIINDNNQPVGFLSRHDYLKAISQLKPQHSVPIIFESISSNIKEELYEQVGKLQTELFVQKYHTRIPIERLELKLSATKNTVGKPKSFTARARVFLRNGQVVGGHASSVRVDQATRGALKKLTHQQPFSE